MPIKQMTTTQDQRAILSQSHTPLELNQQMDQMRMKTEMGFY
jgi:hypothetical protein